MEAENRAGSKGSQGSGKSRPAPKFPLVGFGFTPVSTAREGPEPAWRVKFHGLVSSCLSLSLSLSLFHQCGYHAKLSLFRSFPFPALLLRALHPEDRDLSRKVDGHDNLWMMMMMMMMWYTGFVTDRVPTPTLDNVSWQSLRTPHASEQRFKLLFDCCLTLGCA